MQIILGNVVAFIASVLVIYIGTLKNKKKIIFVQSIQIMLFTLSDIILGGITGAIVNFLSLLRNILCYEDKFNIWFKISIIFSMGLCTVLFNDSGIIGYLPFLTSFIYTIFMNFKDVVKFKIVIVITLLLWCIYDITIISYTSVVFEIIGIFTNIFAIYQLTKAKK